MPCKDGRSSQTTDTDRLCMWFVVIVRIGLSKARRTGCKAGAEVKRMVLRCKGGAGGNSIWVLRCLVGSEVVQSSSRV